MQKEKKQISHDESFKAYMDGKYQVNVPEYDDYEKEQLAYQDINDEPVTLNFD